jgi:hypothetical protein
VPLRLIVEDDYWVVWNDMVGPFPVKAERTCGLVGDSVEHNGMKFEGCSCMEMAQYSAGSFL